MKTNNTDIEEQLTIALDFDKCNSETIISEPQLEEKYATSSFEKYNKEKNQLEIDHLKNELNTQKFLTEDLFKIIKIWFVFIGIVILITGFKLDFISVFPYISINSFNLSDNVLMTLLGSTTVTVVGLYSPVIAHFFNKKK